MKFVIALSAIIAVVIILGGITAMGDAITDFRTDEINDQYIVTTDGSTSTGTVQLTHLLWNDDTANAAIASNITADAPILGDYTASNRTLAYEGLGTGATRTLTITYKSAGLAGYTGADTGIRFFPAILVMACISIPLFTILYLFSNR